jgi:diadenosine tetraphosphate (Ap4A) HIT family hydrolase
MPQTKFHIIGFNPLKRKFLVKNSEETADAFTYKCKNLESAVEEFSSSAMKSVSKIQEAQNGNEVHVLAVVKGDTSTPGTTWMHSEEMTETSPALDSTLSVLGLRNRKKD